MSDKDPQHPHWQSVGQGQGACRKALQFFMEDGGPAYRIGGSRCFLQGYQMGCEEEFYRDSFL